jgi:hypothetical protein
MSWPRGYSTCYLTGYEHLSVVSARSIHPGTHLQRSAQFCTSSRVLQGYSLAYWGARFRSLQ